MSADMVSRFAGKGAISRPSGDPSWLRFASLCELLATTGSKLAKRSEIAGYLRALDAEMAGLAAQFFTGAVFAESDPRKVQAGGQLIIRALEAITGATPELFRTTYRKHGDLGAAAAELLHSTHSPRSVLTLRDVAARLDSLSRARTQISKAAQLTEVLRVLSSVEAKYFIKLLLGDMRIGIKQNLVEEAIAAASQEEVATVRRAETMLGNIAAVVALAWNHELATVQFQMFHPLGFMLATPSANAVEAYARFAPKSVNESLAQIEDKYDGMRAQIHCGDSSQPGRVRIFSRTREDITASFPELTEWFASVGTPAILDGEILAWDFESDRALPFAALQQRLGRKRVTAAMQSATRVLYMAFDILLDGKTLLLDVSLRDRRAALEQWVQDAYASASRNPPLGSRASAQSSLFVTDTVSELQEAIPRLKLAPVRPVVSAEQVDESFSAAQSRGNEGLMLKSLASFYRPGRRGSAWLKLKRELATLDVAVTAAEYGHGRRAAVLSDYTFAVRDGETLRNIGKAYSGLTDAEIETLTQWFLDHSLDERGGQLLVEPKIILEVAFNNVMQSDRHDSGYALRFPRIVRIRTDKPVEEIDTIEHVAEIFRRQHRAQVKGAMGS